MLAAAVGVPLFAAAQTPFPEPSPILHVQTSLVVVDVMVTDSYRNPVHGLTAADFELREDGHAENVKVFEEHTADQRTKAAVQPHLDPGVFSNEFAQAPVGALNLILLDQLNTPEVNQKEVLEQVTEYLRTAPAGARFAILALNSEQLDLIQAHLLQHSCESYSY